MSGLFRQVGPFLAASIVTIALLKLLSVYAFDQYSRYLGREFELLLSFVAGVVGSGVASGILATVLAIRRAGTATLGGRAGRLWAAGVAFAVLVWLPPTIDVAAADGSFDQWGNPASTGIGLATSCAVVLLFPALVGWLVARERNE